MSGHDLSDYIEVPERIARFKEAHPDGSLRGDYQVEQIGEDTLIVYTARAYRSPEDTHPGIGTASEPYPGRTPFTKGAELMNAETSAWGRAIAAIGIVASRKVATMQEVRANQRETAEAQAVGEALPDERIDEIGKAAHEAGLDFQRLCLLYTAVGAEAPKIARRDSIRKATAQLTAEQADELLGRLADG